MKETVLMRVNDNNQQTVTVDGLALWLGISVEEVHARWGAETDHLGTDLSKFPPDWIQIGHRRAREAAAAIGENDLTRILCYWANQNTDGAEVLIVMRED